MSGYDPRTSASADVTAAGEPGTAPAPRFSMMEYVALDLSFTEELRIFAAAGADGVGLSLFKPPRSGRGRMAEMAEVVRACGVQVTYCWPETPSVLPIPGFAGPRDWRERVDAIVAKMDDIAALGPLGVGCVTGPTGGLAADEARRIVVEGLGRIARAAATVGLRVAVEPIHPEESDVFSFVSSVSGAARLIADIGLPNVGIVADVWHLHGQADVIAELEQHAHLIDLVHVCDRRDPTRSSCDRVLPGDGVADVAGFLGALERTGYHGFYELEVISDDGTYGNDFPDSLWRADPSELVAIGKKKFLDCYRQGLTGRDGPDGA
jgi:sugar phosphate isomerase/epimerase